jgi:hypothetical protein
MVYSNITIFFLFEAVSGTACTAAGTECDRIDNSHCDADKCKCNDGFAMNVEVCTAENGGKFICSECFSVYCRQCRYVSMLLMQKCVPQKMQVSTM